MLYKSENKRENRENRENEMGEQKKKRRRKEIGGTEESTPQRNDTGDSNGAENVPIVGTDSVDKGGSIASDNLPQISGTIDSNGCEKVAQKVTKSAEKGDIIPSMMPINNEVVKPLKSDSNGFRGEFSPQSPKSCDSNGTEGEISPQSYIVGDIVEEIHPQIHDSNGGGNLES